MEVLIGFAILNTVVLIVFFWKLLAQRSQAISEQHLELRIRHLEQKIEDAFRLSREENATQTGQFRAEMSRNLEVFVLQWVKNRNGKPLYNEKPLTEVFKQCLICKKSDLHSLTGNN